VDSLLGAERLLAVAEAVDGLSVGRLVPAEPLADPGDGARVELLNVVNLQQKNVWCELYDMKD